MSCDNIPGNGDVAKKAICAFASLRDNELGQWVAENVAFPSSMVDRIVPGFDSKHVKELKNQFGVADEWPVVCEPFFQWVLEDNFPQGRPPLEKAGVQVVTDVEPFELMKLRLLNAGHQALGYFGYLSGYKFAYEAAAKDDFKTLLRAYMDREATPTLPDVPDTDLEEYKATLIERFANPAVADTLKRLCDSASDRIPKFVVPVARENVANGGEVKLAAAIVASWARYAEGVDEWGKDIDVKDSRAEMMTRLAKEQRDSDDSVAFLRVPELFGDLADDKRFSQCYFAALWSLWEHGAEATVKDLVKDLDNS